MGDQIILKGRLEPKSNIISKPEFYSDTSMLCFIIPEAYKVPFLAYYKEHGMLEAMELTVKPWPLDPQERAKRFFFKLRDRVAEQQGDTGRENRDNLYRSAVRSLDLKKEGKLIQSLKDLDKRGLWLATEKMHEYAIEAECYLGDLIPEMKASQQELKK